MRTILFICGLALGATALGMEAGSASEGGFAANLTRAESFVPADAAGRAVFRLSENGREIRYEVTVTNVELVTQAHIHLSPEALTLESFPRRFKEPSQRRHHGPIVAFLMDFVRDGITVDGVLTKGGIEEFDLIGPLRGHSLSRLIEFMKNQDAYVALHVIQQVAPDQVFCCPDGLRGLIRPNPLY